MGPLSDAIQDGYDNPERVDLSLVMGDLFSSARIIGHCLRVNKLECCEVENTPRKSIWHLNDGSKAVVTGTCPENLQVVYTSADDRTRVLIPSTKYALAA